MFSNKKATEKSKQSDNHNWEGDSYNTQWCREKCEQLKAQGKSAFYKKTGDKYTVYSFA